MGNQTVAKESSKEIIQEQNQESSASQSSAMMRSSRKQSIVKRVKPSHSYAQQVTSHNDLSKAAQNIYQKCLEEQKNNPDRTQIIPEVDGPVYSLRNLKATYQGEFNQKKLPEGKGVVYFSNGSFYGGKIVDGEASGMGIYIFQNGSFYYGKFGQGKFNGYGQLRIKNKDIKIKGQFVDGLPSGQCCQIFSDGSYFTGNFKKGVKNGYGEYIWANGRFFKGNFINGEFNGEGIILDKQSGQCSYYGYFKDGRKNGDGLMVTSQGTMMGTFFGDYLEGNGTFCWTDKSKAYKGQFKKSKMHGNGQLCFQNGQLAIGKWQQGHNTELQSIENSPQSYDTLHQIIKKHQGQIKQGKQYSDSHNISQMQKKQNQYSSFNSYLHFENSRLMNTNLNETNIENILQDDEFQQQKIIPEANYQEIN